MEKNKNYYQNSKPKAKSNFLSIICIILAVTLSLGGAAYLFKDNINGLFVKKPVVENPVIVDPIIEEPIIDEPIVEEPKDNISVLSEGMSIENFCFDIANFEDVIKNNIDNLEINTDQGYGRKIVEFSLLVYDVEKVSGSITETVIYIPVGITTFGEIYDLLGMSIPEGVSRNDFSLFLTNSDYSAVDFYASANHSLVVPDYGTIDFIQGFNSNVINIFGEFLIDGYLACENAVPEWSNQYQKITGALLTVETIYNQSVCDLILTVPRSL